MLGLSFCRCLAFNFVGLFSLMFLGSAAANVYQLPESGSRLIGSITSHEVEAGDYFHAIAQHYNIGLLSLMESNPQIDPFLPALGSKLIIPNQMLLPDVPHVGIVINLPEFRLYYFPENSTEVYVFPVGIGRLGRETPEMQSFIKAKIKDPVWTPNAKTRREYLTKYKMELPAIVQPGETNPLGKFALQLGFGNNNYLIHGTNQSFGIGMRISAGCIRMDNKDIEWLFKQVSKDESVRIVNQPIKFATEPNGMQLLEAHSPLSVETDMPDEMPRFKNQTNLDMDGVRKALLLHTGIPTDISI